MLLLAKAECCKSASVLKDLAGFIFQAIQEVLLSPLVQKLDKTKSSVVLALFLYLLLEQYNIPVDTHFLQQLCMGMLLSPEMNNTASADMEKLAFHFPTAFADKR